MVFSMFIVNINSQEIDDENIKNFMDHVIEVQTYCENRENVTYDFDSSSEDTFSETKEWKCMLECVVSELGIVSIYL